jgi:Excalibur calcium-binding domain
MLIAAILITVAPLEKQFALDVISPVEANVTKKRKAASSGSGRKFGSCAAARRAGYTHMRRGKAGYSSSLDRDGDGVACDKVK